MTRRDIRRHERIPCTLPVRLSWADERGGEHYARGKCRDISPDGLRIETSEAIPAQSFVNVRVERVDVAGSGRVRYLRRAGIERAEALVATADEDAENLVIVLTARSVRADLRIVSRVNQATWLKRMKAAGADVAESPYERYGVRLATAALSDAASPT